MTRDDTWDPDQYHRFRAERSAPFFDLLALVQPVDAPRVADLGCGTGELTADTHRALGARSTVGVDRSPAMLESARALRVDGLTFAEGDIATFTPETSALPSPSTVRRRALVTASWNAIT